LRSPVTERLGWISWSVRLATWRRGLKTPVHTNSSSAPPLRSPCRQGLFIRRNAIDRTGRRRRPYGITSPALRKRCASSWPMVRRRRPDSQPGRKALLVEVSLRGPHMGPARPKQSRDRAARHLTTRLNDKHKCTLCVCLYVPEWWTTDGNVLA
jgi:hypothetical protein